MKLVSCVDEYAYADLLKPLDPQSGARVEQVHAGVDGACNRSGCGGLLGVKIWYENNNGGSFQGSLSLGKEYTLNTYEGHVFFFTNDAWTKEYARLVMRKDRALWT